MNNKLKKRLISIVLIMVIVFPNCIITSASDNYNKGYVSICNVGDGDYVSYEAIEVDDELFVSSNDIAEIINMEEEIYEEGIFYSNYYSNRTIDVWFDGSIWTRGITYEAKVHKVDNEFYIPLEKMLYLSNAQWCVKDEIVYVQLTENTILDFIDAYCMQILENNITQTELLMNGESEWSNAAKSSFAAIFNDFDVRVFVPIWGAVTLTVEDYQNAMLQLAKDELEFIDEYGQSNLDNLLTDSGFSEIKSIWDDAQSVADLPEDILTATDYVNKTYLWIKDTKDGTKMFSEYNDLADLTPAEINAISTKLQGISDVLTVANAIVNVNEIATRSKSWNEDFLAQIELLTDFDETGYDKTMVNYIKKASSGLLQEHADTFSATTDACVEESLKVLGEKLVDLTPAGTLTSIITTGLSVAKLLDDDFATSFDALELSNMVEWLIRIEHVAFTEMARDIQTVRTKSINGGSSLEELTELRNITMLSLRTNLRNKVFIYYLNTVRNNDASWINSEEAKAIEQDILWNYGKIIELSESEQLDKLLVLDDFENMYSDEYGCKRDKIDSAILLDKDILSVSKEQRYKAYAEKIQNYESKYGLAKKHTESEWFTFMTGLCFMKLVDFSNNGQEDLMLVYQSNPESVLETFYSEYKYEIWGFEEGKLTMLETGDLFGTDGGETHIILTEYNEKVYLVTGGADSFGRYYYHSYLNNEFEVVREVLWEDNSKGQLVGTINGESVSYDVIEEQQEEWLYKQTHYSLMYDCDKILEQNEETKQMLSPYYQAQTGSSENETIMSAEEIYDKLVEYYKKGTPDSPGDDLTVMRGEMNDENQYCTSVRCGVPGNSTATQRLYDIVVDGKTGNVIQTRVLVDNQIVEFNLNEE